MSWTKLSDDFSDDCWTLSDAAFRLHVEGLGWSNRKLLDLVIPADDLPRFAKHLKGLGELLDVGWWTSDDDGKTYVIRHHASYQRPREMVLHLQDVAAKNGKKGGRPHREQATRRNPAANPAAKPAANPQGQDRTGKGSTTEAAQQNWPEVTTPGTASVCAGCGLPMTIREVGQTTHPTCGRAA